MKYKCNLCQTEKYFVCEFDHHMRNHTKYGNLVAIVDFKSIVQEVRKTGHLNCENSTMIEQEFLKIDQVIAVLAIVWNEHLKDKEYFTATDLEDVDVGAILLVNSDPNNFKNILPELNDTDIIQDPKLLVMKPHHIPDNCEWFCNEEYKRNMFESLFLWTEPFSQFCKPLPCSKLYDRNKALLTTTCSLT